MKKSWICWWLFLNGEKREHEWVMWGAEWNDSKNLSLLAFAHLTKHHKWCFTVLYSSSRRLIVRNRCMLTPFSISSLTKSTRSITRASNMAFSRDPTCNINSLLSSDQINCSFSTNAVTFILQLYSVRFVQVSQLVNLLSAFKSAFQSWTLFVWVRKSHNGQLLNAKIADSLKRINIP